MYLPGASSEKQVYPILGYNEEAEPKILIGGFGIGALIYKTINEKFKAKGQLNLTRYVYWDASQFLIDSEGNPVGNYFYGTAEYNLGLNATINFALAKKFRIGTGVGTQILISSVSRFPEDLYSNSTKHYNNKYYKRVMPMIPFEISYNLKRVLLSIRYEQALLNKFRGDFKRL